MNQLVGQRETLIAALQSTLATFQADGPTVQQVMNKSLGPMTEEQRQVQRAKIIQKLQEALDDALAAKDDGGFFLPRSQAVAPFQVAMEEFLGPNVAVSRARSMVDAKGIPLPEKFGPTDPLWIECVVDQVETWIAGKAKFVSHTQLTDFFFEIDDNCKIVLVADWGAENDSAQNVAKEMKSRAPDYAIHLGDIYYAGEVHEAERFLSSFSGIPGKRSFAMNGNHEMYSGGHPYFEKVLPALQQPASYFGLHNQNWQLLGLDSAYVDHVLTSPTDAQLLNQFNWTLDKLKVTGKKNIVLTHHQPFSAYQPEHDDGAKMREDIGRIDQAIQPCPIFAWFAGHEHRCTIYNDSFTEFKFRLIGNGCIPHLPQTPPDPLLKGPIPFDAINTKARPDGSGYAISGFVLLTFNGPNLKVEYVNEDGTLFHTESWSAQAAARAAS